MTDEGLLQAALKQNELLQRQLARAQLQCHGLGIGVRTLERELGVARDERDTARKQYADLRDQIFSIKTAFRDLFEDL